MSLQKKKMIVEHSSQRTLWQRNCVLGSCIWCVEHTPQLLNTAVHFAPLPPLVSIHLCLYASAQYGCGHGHVCIINVCMQQHYLSHRSFTSLED